MTCASPLAIAVVEQRGRRVVTTLFADLAGFTRRSESLDVEDVEGFLDPYFAVLREPSRQNAPGEGCWDRSARCNRNGRKGESSRGRVGGSTRSDAAGRPRARVVAGPEGVPVIGLWRLSVRRPFQAVSRE